MEVEPGNGEWLHEPPATELANATHGGTIDTCLERAIVDQLDLVMGGFIEDEALLASADGE